ncbi:hypothetical protein [Lignipirellula cremea]|uniref:Uncharacterized protein n=1 Tax=Lignipirellula cremea TaxID=2528010 RepID=A0A518DM98_9BACT|nr:hypothetical protein [Lignipirellula cremea]QDU92953.1 hypothetical protein Pla8534_07260 [Lignipirellula cremea]
MSISRNRMTSEPQGAMGKLKNDTSESISELRDFLGRMRGKNPQEVLGAVANSGLVATTLGAGAVCAALLFGMSLLSWSMKEPAAETAAAAPAETAPAADQAATEDAAATSADASAAAANTTAAADDPDQGTASGDPTLDRMGIGETKTAAPTDNPLDKGIDNLLDDLK